MLPEPTGEPMKRRSKVSGERIKARGRKTPGPQRPHGLKAAPRSKPSPTKETDVVRLARELSDERRQRTATSEVLRLLSGSHGDLNHLFDTILANATNICQANFGTLSLYESDAFRIVAMHNVPPGLAELRRREPLVRAGPLLRIAETKRLLHIADYTEYVASHPADSDAAVFAKLTGVRTTLEVPMLKNDEVVGAIVIYRTEVRSFDDREIVLIKDFAAQAVIAIENTRLLNELRQRTSDLTEALQQQIATSDVLGIISSSQSDLQPVFRTILENATRICEAKFGFVHRYDGQLFQPTAQVGAPEELVEFHRKRGPFRPEAGSMLDQIIHTKQVGHTPDITAENFPVAAAKIAGARSTMAVPMLRDRTLLGALVIYRLEVRPFTDKQISLVQNFAAQAVIAIENARLLKELRQRTDDLTEALEQQTATSDLLQVISGSPGNLEPVFQAMLENAVGICGANFGNMFLYEDDAFRTVAMFNAPEAYANARMGAPFHPPSDSALGRLVATKEVVQIADLRAVERYVINRDPFVVPAVELAGIRTLLAVPMLKEGRLVGVIVIYRQEVRPFGEKQTELVKNFASQVVIAIENARLLNELRQRTTDLTERTDDLTEALEQQTATSEVLQVISSSPGDLEPVFASMLEKAVRICDAGFGNIYRVEGDGLRNVATHKTPAVFVEALRSSPYFRPGPKNPVRRMMETKAVVHVVDNATTEAYAEREPIAVASVELGDTRTLMVVPMLKDNELVGAFTLARQEVRPFTDKQITLVTNFAAQAVIAIENERLLQELRERTEQWSN